MTQEHLLDSHGFVCPDIEGLVDETVRSLAEGSSLSPLHVLDIKLILRPFPVAFFNRQQPLVVLKLIRLEVELVVVKVFGPVSMRLLNFFLIGFFAILL